jgi:DNA-binding NarL/FixJ family response regulator
MKLSLKAKLTPREKEIYYLLLAGWNNKLISNKLIISPTTTKTHIHSIYEKLKVKSQVELMAMRIKELVE